MLITLPDELKDQVQRELSSGRFQNLDELVEQAVREFLRDRQRGERRLAALRRIGQSVDEAGCYDRSYIPEEP